MGVPGVELVDQRIALRIALLGLGFGAALAAGAVAPTTRTAIIAAAITDLVRIRILLI
jgi:hypothetical protein